MNVEKFLAEAHMSDLEKFKQFFDEMGIVFRPSPHHVSKYDKGDLRKSKTVVSVTQCHFHFDEAENYLGAEADEMGYFIPRES